jgi:predicted ATPase/transcriptional regulator with XRE-family HTH domain
MLPRMPAADHTTGPRFGEVLRRLRERAGLTQQELAELADLTPHAISSLERGTRTRPYPHTVRSLADALSLPESERAALIAAVPSRQKPDTQPTARRPVGLVVPPTAMFGREDDVSAVTNLLRSGAPLVTLTGPGGVGKTRLAAAVSEAVADDYPDGVIQVSLAPLVDSTAVIATTARALGLTGSDGTAAFDVVVDHLRRLRLLLVLDNFEHLLSAAPDVGRLTALCPDLRVLVTSRSALRVRAEHEYAVAPLALPRREAATAEMLAAAPAGALMLDRARAVAVSPTGEDVPAYVELCHRLAGLPLAIELATVHLRMLPPRLLLDRLDEATAASGARDLPERQRTMRATLDWSYGLLTAEQQRMFTLLGVFRGGATLSAVEHVASGEFANRDVVGLLGQLVEHSLVTGRPGSDGEHRFTMLEPVAQYARSLLVGDRADQLVRAHAQVFLELTEQAAVGYEHADQVAWLARVEADEANVLVAIERALDIGDAPTAARITWFMWLYWWLRGQVFVGRRLAESCLAADLPAWERSRAHLARATMSFAGGDHEAAAGSWAASDRLGEELEDYEVLAKARAGTGLAALAAGDLTSAEQRFRAALEFGDKAGPAGGDWLVTLVHVWLGTVLLLQSSPAGAVPEIERGLAAARSRGDRLSTYIALYNLSQAAIALDDLGRARAYLDEGITLSEETRDLANLAFFLETLAVVESKEGDHATVPSLLGAGAGLREAVGAAVHAYYLPDETLRAAAELSSRAALGAREYDERFEVGRRLGLDGSTPLVG